MSSPDKPSLSAADAAPGGLERGRGLVEALVTLSLIAVVVTVTVPCLDQVLRAAALRSVAQQVSGLLVRSRVTAVVRRRTTAVVFERGQPWQCYVAVDGDGDGVRREDLDSGRDQVIGARVRLRESHGSLGILRSEPVPDPAGGGFLAGDLDDPVRAGRGDMVSFSPLGTASPASLFFTDNRSQMRALRVYGATGRTRSLVWRSGWREWRQSWW